MLLAEKYISKEKFIILSLITFGIYYCAWAMSVNRLLKKHGIERKKFNVWRYITDWRSWIHPAPRQNQEYAADFANAVQNLLFKYGVESKYNPQKISEKHQVASLGTVLPGINGGAVSLSMLEVLEALNDFNQRPK